MTPEAPKGAPGGTKKHPGTTFGWSKSTRDPPREHQEAPASTRGTRKHPGTNFGWSKSTREQGAPREHPGTTNEHQGAPGGTKKHPGTTFGWSKSTMELPGTPRMQGSPGSSRTHPGTIFGWSKSTRDLPGSTQGALGGVAWCTQINGKFYLVARPPYFLATPADDGLRARSNRTCLPDSLYHKVKTERYAERYLDTPLGATTRPKALSILMSTMR